MNKCGLSQVKGLSTLSNIRIYLFRNLFPEIRSDIDIDACQLLCSCRFLHSDMASCRTDTLHDEKVIEKLAMYKIALNPFTPRFKPLNSVNKCGCTFWVCGWNPRVWLFKWKLLSNTIMWYCLLLTILQNLIQNCPLSFELSTLGSEWVKSKVIWKKDAMQ